MKLYLAAVRSTIEWALIPAYQAGEIRRPEILLSYWAFRRENLDILLRPFMGAARVFADSGAYSAWTLGGKIELSDYYKWICRWHRHFEAYANLDVIGDAEATEANQAQLERAGLRPLPVFHFGENPEILDSLCDRYPYIALGGMVGKPRKALENWTADCFKIAASRAVFHGFGLSAFPLMKARPWYSVDSSTYAVASKYGRRVLFDSEGQQFLSFRYGGRDHGEVIRAHGRGAEHMMSKRPIAPLQWRMGAVACMKARDWINDHNPLVEIPGRGE